MYIHTVPRWHVWNAHYTPLGSPIADLPLTLLTHTRHPSPTLPCPALHSERVQGSDLLNSTPLLRLPPSRRLSSPSPRHGAFVRGSYASLPLSRPRQFALAMQEQQSTLTALVDGRSPLMPRRRGETPFFCHSLQVAQAFYARFRQ